jgi:hypothetical protein
MSDSAAVDVACALDPVAYAAQLLHWQADVYQARVLRSRHKRLLLCCTRQFGKSTTAAVSASHHALYHPRAVVAVSAPVGRQARELALKIEQMLELSPSRLGGRVRRRDDELGLVLENGARIVSLPGREANVRGLSGCTYLVIDEASRVPDALYKSLRPMLATTDGRTLLMSTPFGQRGFFHASYGSDAGERLVVRAVDCPRISASFLEAERRELGDVWFRQEYMCEFIDTSTGLFPHSSVLEAVDAELGVLSL